MCRVWDRVIHPALRVFRVIGQLKYDGIHADTEFLLSAKRTSPFKSVGGGGGAGSPVYGGGGGAHAGEKCGKNHAPGIGEGCG